MISVTLAATEETSAALVVLSPLSWTRGETSEERPCEESDLLPTEVLPLAAEQPVAALLSRRLLKVGLLETEEVWSKEERSNEERPNEEREQKEREPTEEVYDSFVGSFLADGVLKEEELKKGELEEQEPKEEVFASFVGLFSADGERGFDIVLRDDLLPPFAALFRPFGLTGPFTGVFPVTLGLGFGADTFFFSGADTSFGDASVSFLPGFFVPEYPGTNFWISRRGLWDLLRAFVLDGDELVSIVPGSTVGGSIGFSPTPMPFAVAIICSI